jgi:hypothetical protein
MDHLEANASPKARLEEGLWTGYGRVRCLGQLVCAQDALPLSLYGPLLILVVSRFCTLASTWGLRLL